MYLQILRKSILAIILIVASCISFASAQPTGDNASAPPLGFGSHVWSDTIANPTNPRNIVVCGARWLPSNNAMASFVYASFDGGNTWALTLDDRSTWWQTEQSCAFGSGNRVYFNSESSRPIDGDLHHELGQMHFYRSIDGGKTWLAPYLSGWFDHSAMTVDPRGTIYLFANATSEYWNNTFRIGPALRVSHDGGQSFGKMVELPTRLGSIYSGAYPSAARVLRSGRVIAVMYARHKGDDARRAFRVDVAWTDDGGKTLGGGITIARDQFCSSDGNMPSMAVDGANPQRVYVAFSQRVGNVPYDRVKLCRAVLAYSDDGGTHWVTRVVPGAGNAAGAAVSVNRRGIVAVASSEQPNRCWRFQYSTNQGATFSKATDLTPCHPFRPNERYFQNSLWAAAAYDAPPHSTDAQYSAAYENNLGITVRGQMGQVWRSNMAASSDGVFYIAWPAPGTGWLNVARARVGGNVVSVHDVQITPRTIPVSQLPNPDTIPAWQGGANNFVDVTKTIGLMVNGAKYDATGKTVTLQFQLSNRGSEPLYGPLLWRIVRLDSDVGAPIGTDVQRGSTVDLSQFLPNGTLAAFAASDPITIRFKILRYRLPASVIVGSYRIVALASRVWAQVHAPPTPQQ
ncbi:MAG TPA: sialidase family protein [Candidatus Baltobacteraceae bacterium]|jgi:hypothetical protein